MKKIIIALLLTPLLSFSSLATDTQPVNTAGSENTPNTGGNGPCSHYPARCDVMK
jgi:hypothetical protein